MSKNIQELLYQAIQNSLKAAQIELADNTFSLDIPQNAAFGDLSTNLALKAAKVIKKSPRDAAAILISEIKAQLAAAGIVQYIKEIRIEGAGFINFYFTEKYFYEQLKSTLQDGSNYFKLDLGKSKKILLEFVSANPTGSLSVAHARQAAVGDALANILKFLGFNAQKEYYLNDEGNQINILGRSVELRLKELKGEKIEFPEDHYQGDYIVDIAREVLEKNLQINDFGEFAGNYILDIIRKELDDFGVHFDCWYSQKELGKSGKIERYIQDLKNKGYVYEQDGATWLKSTEFGDDKDRVIIKSDGSYTYLAPDIAYHQEKYNRGYEWLINMWGPDHHGYISRLKASVAAFGKNPDSLSVIIVQLATIFRAGKPVQMSTRKGQYITLREVLDEVGPDAARFFFMMRRTSSHLDFDLDIAKKQSSENPVFYVQYAYARISSILRQAVKVNPDSTDFGLLKEKEELFLAKKICQFSSVLEACLATTDPYMITVYLQELSECFHKFYDLHRVLGQEDALTNARLALLEATRITLACGLDLLGVSKPEKM